MKYYSKKRKSFISFVIVVLPIFLIFIFFKPLSLMVKSLGFFVWKSNAGLTDDVSNLFKSKKALSEENIKLTQELSEANIKLIEMSALGDENKKIKEMLGRLNSENTIIAGLITSPNQSLYNTFNIDAGSSDGISAGAKVFVGDSLVGYITDVFKNFSTVRSLSSPGEKTNAFVAESDISITVLGRGGDFEIDLPRDIPFQPGMAIISQGINPKVIAIIEKIISDPRDPFQRVLARLPVNMRTVRWVFVEKI